MPVNLFEAERVEKAIMPVKDKEHGKKGDRRAQDLTNGPAVDPEVAMKKE